MREAPVAIEKNAVASGRCDRLGARGPTRRSVPRQDRRPRHGESRRPRRKERPPRSASSSNSSVSGGSGAAISFRFGSTYRTPRRPVGGHPAQTSCARANRLFCLARAPTTENAPPGGGAILGLLQGGGYVSLSVDPWEVGRALNAVGAALWEAVALYRRREPSQKVLSLLPIGLLLRILEPQYEHMCDSCVIRVTDAPFPRPDCRGGGTSYPNFKVQVKAR